MPTKDQIIRAMPARKRRARYLPREQIHYVIKHEPPEWVVYEITRTVEAVRGRYATKLEAERRLVKLPNYIPLKIEVLK